MSRALVKDLHAAGFKLVLWHTSWINDKTSRPHEEGFADKIDVKSSNYDEAAAHGYFVKDKDGRPYEAHGGRARAHSSTLPTRMPKHGGKGRLAWR